MTKLAAGTSVALVLGLMAIGAPVFADSRTERESRGSTPPIAVPTIPPSLGTLPTFSNTNSGNTSSGASAQSNSGGNSGGNVSTGDEHSTVTIINVGTTNSGGSSVTPAPQSAPGSQCALRSCLRTH